VGTSNEKVSTAYTRLVRKRLTKSVFIDTVSRATYEGM